MRGAGLGRRWLVPKLLLVLFLCRLSPALRMSMAAHPLAWIGVASALLAAGILTGPGRARFGTQWPLLALLSPVPVREAVLAQPDLRLLLWVLPAWPASVLSARLAIAFGGTAGRLPARLLHAVRQVAPKAAEMGRTEISLLWFGLVRWRRHPADRPAGATAFPATATGNDVAMAWTSVAGAAIHIPLIHLLVWHLSRPLAWCITGSSLLGMVYLAGFAKSLALRPTLLFEGRLLVRLGAARDRSVALGEIAGAAILTGGADRRPGDVRLYGFDEPNLRVETAQGGLLFRVDDPRGLLAAIGAQPAGG